MKKSEVNQTGEIPKVGIKEVTEITEADLKNTAKDERRISRNKKFKQFLNNYDLYILVLPTVLFFLVFHYFPMYGVQIAFKEFNPMLGITGSPWIGFTHFERFFNSHHFRTILVNTFGLALYQMATFPIPIIMALLLNQLVSERFKKIVQTVTYAPHFISVVVIVGMMFIFLSPRSGLVNQVIQFFGGDPVFFLGRADLFRPIYTLSGVWQSFGFSMIIYLAALSSVSPEQHEAAIMDGANKLERIWYIDIPAITPTIIILLILNIGNFLNIGFEKVYLMQNALNLQTSEIIQTHVYKMGLLGSQYSYSTAVGLFNSVVNFILLVSVNRITKKLTETSLW